MHLNLHGYKYKIQDVAWVLDGLTPRRGLIKDIEDDVYSILMDDSGNIETFTNPMLFPLKSLADIYVRQFLITPTPSISHSVTPTPSRTPKPMMPSPTPSSSHVNKPNLLNTSTATWASTEGVISIISDNKMKITSDIVSVGPIYAISENPGNDFPIGHGVDFNTTVTVQPHSDYMVAFDLEQGSCRFISVEVKRSGSDTSLFYSTYTDTTRVNLILNSYDSTSFTIHIQLYDEANFNKKARHGRYYTINNMNMRFIRANNVIFPTPTPTNPSADVYDSVVTSKNPVLYWSLKNGLNSYASTNPLELGLTTSLKSDSYGNVLNTVLPQGQPDPLAIYGAKLTTPVSLSTNYSLEAWINLTNLGSGSYSNIFGTDSDNGTGLLMNSDGTLSLYGDNDYFEIDFGFQYDTDYHVVLTVDGSGTIIIYVNGSAFTIGDSHSFSNISTDTYNYSYIGNDATMEVVFGTIGNPAIYAFPLTEAQVLANYNAGTNGYRYTASEVIAPAPPVYVPYTLSRLNTDGTIDESYVDIQPNNAINAIAKFNDKIAIGGEFTGFNGNNLKDIVKLNVDGTSSSTNYNPTEITSGTFKVCGTGDGKVFVASANGIKQFNSDGTENVGFNLGFSGNFNDITSDQNGMIYFAGSFSFSENDGGYGVLRLNSDGTVDDTFRVTLTNSWENVGHIKVTADGKIYIYGGFTSINSVSNSNSFARLNSDGTLDGTFTGVSGITGYGIGFFEQMSDGKIYLGGSNNNCIRLNSDGTLDGTFTTFSTYNGSGFAIELVDKIYVSYYDYGATAPRGIVRLNSDGTLDGTFTTLETDDMVNSMTTSNDGKLYVSGAFTTIGGYNYNNIARLNADGTVDNTFIDPKIANGDASGLILTKIPNGEMFAVGNFYSVGGTLYQRLSMLNTDGTLDTSFNGLYVGGTLYDIMESTTGSLYYTGNFNTSQVITDVQTNGLGRLNSDGSFDDTLTVPSFGGSTSVGGIYHLLEAIDGKIYTLFSSNYSSGTVVNLLRQNSDGTNDTDYVSPNFSGTPYVMYQTADGKIYVGGQFKTVDSIAYNQFCRLNSDGTLDTTFTDIGIPVNGGQAYAMGHNQGVSAITQDSNGKIYIGGDFNAVGASSSPYIARLNSNGTVDATFGVAIANAVSKLSYINGRIYIINYNKLNRLNTDGSLDTSFEYTSHNIFNSIYENIDGKIYVATD